MYKNNIKLKCRHIQAYERIVEAENILLVTHKRGDADAFSSVGAMMELLLMLGKKYTAYCTDLPPLKFTFLPQTNKFINDKSKLNFSQFDLIIVLDCGGLSRTNLDEEIKNKNLHQTIIEFDHHIKVDDYAQIEIRDVEASATAEIIYNFFRANNLPFNKNIANCVLAGILTDTANFLYPSTSDATINIASEMLSYGANYNLILESTWRNKSLDAIKLWGLAMSSLQINKKYNFAISILTEEDLNKNNVSEEELEGIAGFLSNLYGVNGIMFLREEKNNIIKGSLRTSHPTLDVSKLARLLGGGGHKKASGFTVEGRLERKDGSWKIV